MGTTLRAVVMLSVLVGLPAAWIYYGPLPAEGQRLVDRFVGVAKEVIGWSKPSAADAKDFGAAVTKASATRFSRESSLTNSEAPLAPALLPARPATFAEQVEPLLTRLRQLGVVEYALERWGEGGKLYRFRCEMPVGASALTQQFEAVADDPQATVEQVVTEISQWQLSQHAGM
jgi:hypothetical protein